MEEEEKDVIRRVGLEIVGAASLFSIETNEQIALDEDTVKGLINAVESHNRSVSMAACNAILDLFTTSIGRLKLLEFSAINNLIAIEMNLFVESDMNLNVPGEWIHVPKSSTPSISLIIMEEVHDKTFFRIGFMEDEYPVLLLHVAITLINDCTVEQLRKVPRGLSRKFLLYLAMLWAEVHKHKLIETVPESERFFCLSNIRTNHLAESLFRLSMDETFTTPSKFQEVKRSIFHLGHISFESFIVNHWEQSPLLIQRPSEDVLHDNVFSSFSQFLRSKETVSSFLGFLLQNLTSALPINSDELDIVGFLKEARD
ncbi:jmjC domain, Armadillo-type fold protein [Artemisia annua]|uniref:JmjC domain, Armadillo-type fold protein n=1 Tax=Artemisia annua TaxID=35608 RepID=A0A2U1L173_ARTAN|nr:jmjC domain, Armadillo-type fold protein [Artemisia annua]